MQDLDSMLIVRVINNAYTVLIYCCSKSRSWLNLFEYQVSSVSVFSRKWIVNVDAVYTSSSLLLVRAAVSCESPDFSDSTVNDSKLISILTSCYSTYLSTFIRSRGGTGREFRRVPDPGTRPLGLLPGRTRVFNMWCVKLLLFVTFCMIPPLFFDNGTLICVFSVSLT